MPEVSIIGTETTAEEEGEEGSDPAEERTTEDRTSVRSEEYWKEETRRFAISIRDAQRDAEELDQECEDLGKQAAYAVTDPTQYVEINGVLIPIAGSGYDAVVRFKRRRKYAVTPKRQKRNFPGFSRILRNFRIMLVDKEHCLVGSILIDCNRQKQPLIWLNLLGWAL